MHFSQKLTSLIFKVESSHCHQHLERIQRNYEFLMIWVLLHFELMTVHFTEGKHITLPNQPEGERVQRGDEKKNSKTGVKGFTMVTRCCLSESSQNFGQSATHYQRGPQRPIECQRGLWRSKSKHMWDQVNCQRRRKLFPSGGRKCSSIIQFMFLAGWHSPGMSLWKSFLETQLSFASFHPALVVVKSPECSHCWKHCKNCECPPRTGCDVSIECRWLKVLIECLKRDFQCNVNLNLNVSDSMPQILVSILKLLLCHWIVLKNVSEVQNIFQYFFQKLWGFFVFLSVKNWKELLTSDC